MAKESREGAAKGYWRRHCLRSIQMADRQAACRSLAGRGLGSSVIAGQSDRTNALRGCSRTDGVASRVHQENSAHARFGHCVGAETLQGVATWQNVTYIPVPDSTTS